MKDSNQTLSFRQVGRGFIMVAPTDGMLTGRRLATAYVDQFNRKYVLINGRYELLTVEHRYLSVE